MFDIKENLNKLPDKPGVYLHKDRLGQVIYVGKAISLRNRVRQYFQKSAQQNPKTRALVDNITEFEWITCTSEMEALILECNLIKKFMPKYNVLLRDDKTYPYIMVTTGEPYPRIVKTRIKKRDGNRYFGPYSDVGAVNRIVDLLNNAYGFKRCSMTDFPMNFRPCLNFHINACRGICTGKVDKSTYMRDIEEAMDYLRGADSAFIKGLSEKMNEASEALNFEEAAKYRDLIADAKSLSQAQNVDIISDDDLDVVLPLRTSSNSFVVVFPVRKGKLSGRESFQIQADDEEKSGEIVGQFLKQFYSQWSQVPPTILIESDIEERELIEEFLSGYGHKVKIHKPERGIKKNLLTMVQRDRNEMMDTIDARAKLNLEKSSQLKKELDKLISVLTKKEADIVVADKTDYRIEAYDISNTNGVDSVGAMVVFRGLRPVKKDYRRFKIRTVDGPDDYASLQEVLYRRFKRALDGDKSFAQLPDLIFMDGGQGQVTAALKVLRAMKISIPVVGLAKDDSHRTKAIVFSDGEEWSLKDHPLIFKYCGRIQEEVHRFAIEYHKKLRGNKLTSALDNIKGVGPVKRNALLSHFGNIDIIKAASKAELMEVSGITDELAGEIIKYFSSKA